jgi:hypothetical protein|tara:strand:- start:26 stop:214 length:189 start_codon:yes stop_codon:yes gene_type:complete
MTDQEQIEHLKDQIFKLRIAVQGISGIASANADWAKDSFERAGFKKIEEKLDQAVEEIKMRP